MKPRSRIVTAWGRLLYFVGISAAVLAGWAMCCHAADTTNAKAKSKKTGRTEAKQKIASESRKVDVTGTLLKQPVNPTTGIPDTVSPVVIIDRKQMERTGTATLLGYLSRQPSVR